MYYTMASIKETHSGFTVDLNANGNKYTVYAMDEGLHIHRSKTFDELKDAEQAFTTLTHYIINGLHNTEGRFAVLA